eukprot:Rhum_TRINITY_DN14424_c4_g1::Rhum_TRINITY_DN14424_c4_g1_i1::g.89111::m.89111
MWGIGTGGGGETNIRSDYLQGRGRGVGISERSGRKDRELSAAGVRFEEREVCVCLPTRAHSGLGSRSLPRVSSVLQQRRRLDRALGGGDGGGLGCRVALLRCGRRTVVCGGAGAVGVSDQRRGAAEHLVRRHRRARRLQHGRQAFGGSEPPVGRARGEPACADNARVVCGVADCAAVLRGVRASAVLLRLAHPPPVLALDLQTLLVRGFLRAPLDVRVEGGLLHRTRAVRAVVQALRHCERLPRRRLDVRLPVAAVAPFPAGAACGVRGGQARRGDGGVRRGRRRGELVLGLVGAQGLRGCGACVGARARARLRRAEARVDVAACEAVAAGVVDVVAAAAVVGADAAAGRGSGVRLRLGPVRVGVRRCRVAGVAPDAAARVEGLVAVQAAVAVREAAAAALAAHSHIAGA